MTPDAILAFLRSSLLAPVAVATLAWLTLRLLRVRHPATGHAVWTAVIAALLLIPAASLAPRWSLRVLPSRGRAVSAPVRAASEPPYAADAPAAPAAHSAPAPRPTPIPTAAILLAIYLAGLALSVAWRVSGWLQLRRLLRRAQPVRGRVLRESPGLASPVAAGLVRPVVLLPTGWRTWPAGQTRAVLAHEFAHLRRRDLAVSALARLAQSIFWFHPLSWWLGRKLSDLAELSCDLAALRRATSTAAYSHILLDFTAAISNARRGAALPGLAMAARSPVGQRIDLLFDLADLAATRSFSRPALAFALAAAPLICLAATANLAEQAAQTPARPLPKFDVISVKPCSDADIFAADSRGGRGGGGGGSAGGPNNARIKATPGRISATCQSVDSLIRTAYMQFPDGRAEVIDPVNGIRYPRLSLRQMTQEIKGSPAWLRSDRYTIDATAGETGGSVPTRETMLGPMLQSLLESRFALRVRTESRDTPMFALSVAKGGPKLDPPIGKCISLSDATKTPAPPTPSPAPPFICGLFRHRNTGEAHGESISMGDFARELSRLLDLDVIDRTGVAGRYDITMQLTTADVMHGLAFPPGSKMQEDIDASRAAATDPPGTSLFAALGKLGLRLDQVKAPVDYLLIDHVERPKPN